MNLVANEKLFDFFADFSFVTLFFSMLSYWIQASGLYVNSASVSVVGQRPSQPKSGTVREQNNSLINSLSATSETPSTYSGPMPEDFWSKGQQAQNPIPTLVDVNFFSQFVTQFLSSFSSKGIERTMFLTKPTFGRFFIFLANVSLFLLLCVRWAESGHFPLSNLYESLIFLTWCLPFGHLIQSKRWPVLNCFGSVL